MYRSANRSLAVAALGVASSIAVAAPVLDGSRDAEYGSAAAVQTVETQFGDANPNGGSELDAGYGVVVGGNLHLMLTGNLESNFNKLNIFIDSVAGGENVITNNTGNGGNNPSNDNWAAKYAGYTFDNPFAADYMIITRNGNGNTFDVDFTSVGNTSVVLGAGNIFSGSTTGSNASALPNGIGVAFDNSNVAGVLGGTGAANQAAAAAVTTGLELVIPLSAIGNPGDGDVILISAMVNGSNHDYLSNQFLGGLAAGQGNLGGDGAGGFNGTVGQLNMNNFAGDQYFRVVVPEPATLSALALAGLGLLRRRR